MERKYAKFFINMVRELIKDNAERDRLFAALRQYQTDRDLSRFMDDLHTILDDPSKLELFDWMRPLVLLHHQIDYSQLIPSMPGVKARIVRLRRRAGEGLGFAVRGGVEHGIGVFVTDVQPGSQAAKQGLLIGDEILSVNGFSISEAIHDDVLNLIKTKDDIVLRVTKIGMLPVKDASKADVTWNYVIKKTLDDLNESQKSQDLKIFIDTSGQHSLGCGILSGPPHLPGIFVERVRPGSLAEEVNLEPGDQIVEVNGTKFHKIAHKEAIVAMVSSRQLHMVIRKGVGIKLMKNIPDLNQEVKAKPNGETSSYLSSSQIGERSGGFMNSTNGNASYLGSSTQGSKDMEARGSSRGVSDWMPHFPDSIRKTTTSPPTSPSSYFDKRKIYSDQSFPSSPSSSSSSSSPFSSMSSNNMTSQMRGQSVNKQANRNSGSEIRDEIKNRLESSARSAPLSGAAAIMQQRKLQNSQHPGLLGFGEDFQYNETVPNSHYTMFFSTELDGRVLHSLTYNKKMDLGVILEGGLGSPLNGKVLVATIFDDGVARKCGKMRVGDQLMAVNGTKLVDITVTKAEALIHDAASSSQEMVELLFCASTLVNEEESMTYF